MTSPVPRSSLPLFAAGFLVSTIYYIITPILPIYCIESCTNGGLEWSRPQTFSLVGTYIAVGCSAPFLGGLCADFFSGRRTVAYSGYAMAICGIFFLPVCRHETSLLVSVLLVSLGTGFVKVCLMSSLGAVTASMAPHCRQRLYDCYYVAICMGYVSGNFISNPLFDFLQIKGIVMAVIAGLLMSSFFGVRYFTPFVKKELSSEPAHPLPRRKLLLVLSGLTALGISFFLVSHQSGTSICMFTHQVVDRSLFGFTIPTLWFVAFGSLLTIFFVPIRRKLWKGVDESVEIPEFPKTTVGFLLSCSAFACLGILALYHSSLHLSLIFMLFLANAIFFIADTHVRPMLFSAATRYVPQRYHTFSTAVVYTSIGLGGKLAGLFAGKVDTIGFASVFFTCSGICLVSATAAILLWMLAIREKAQALST